jgi:hypothetical protein
MQSPAKPSEVTFHQEEEPDFRSDFICRLTSQEVIAVRPFGTTDLELERINIPALYEATEMP